MAIRRLLAIFRNDQDAADATDALQGLGMSDGDFEILSGVPYPEGAFGERIKRLRIYVFPFIGAFLGLAVALLLTIGTQISYPVVTGGKPILSIPAMAIVSYEGTMLGAILFTVIGIIFESRLPRLKLGLYDDRITAGFIGILIGCPEERISGVQQAMRKVGAEEIKLESEES